ncbi:MAG: hypothetical protein HYZ83_07130 [Candidatus Omnitrophica bacterium]|nr:hypothetical protein [Candidatus Omnitrophota bacterium]
MKSKLVKFLGLGVAVLSLIGTVNVPMSVAAEGGKELVLADFDTGDKPNNIGGDFGAWDKDPNDDTQGTQMAFEPDDALGDAAGYSVRLDYDVDSPNPAYNGFWMKLNGEDASQYNTLNFYLKGDTKATFTKRMKIELKDMTNKPSPYIITGITDQWQKFSIPFEKFRRITDWSSMNEFVVVFDDINSSPKAGTVFVDHVSFSKE